MINTNHLLKVSAAWVSIIYVVCFLGVALFSGMRSGFMFYALHMRGGQGVDSLSITTLITGLIIWNIIALLAVGLFAYLFNTIKNKPADFS